MWFFTTGAVLGLRTLAENEDSFWLLTIRRAWLAVKRLFSLGGEPDMVAAVGLLARRWVRVAESWTLDVREMEPERLRALLILAPSILSTCQLLSPSEDELLPLSVGVMLFLAACMMLSDVRLRALEALISRKGD